MQAQTPAPPSTPLPEIRDIAPPVDVFPWPLWLVCLVALGACVVLGIVVWLIVRAIRNRPPPPPLSARAIALRELERLRGEVNSLDAHAFSVTVSDVLRTFIGKHFGLHATTQTSPEFLASIAHAPQFSGDDRTLLARFLDKCDLIKFANLSADKDEMGELLSSAVSFVQGGRA